MFDPWLWDILKQRKGRYTLAFWGPNFNNVLLSEQSKIILESSDNIS